jgi:hypothetical protein
LSQDEVASRKHVIWCEQKKNYIGHVSFSSDITELASKALVFMATGVNTSWKVPLGYFYVNGFDGEKRAKLLDECLKFLHNVCDTLEVCSITFDGDGANWLKSWVQISQTPVRAPFLKTPTVKNGYRSYWMYAMQ